MGAVEEKGRPGEVRPDGPAASGNVRPGAEHVTAEQGEPAGDGDASGGCGEVDLRPTSKRVFSRDELVELLVERADDVTKVGKVLKFVESALRLQNDKSRPVYVLEVKPNVTLDDIELLDVAMNQLGVACVLIPSGVVSYVGEVDSESFGRENVMDELVRTARFR